MLLQCDPQPRVEANTNSRDTRDTIRDPGNHETREATDEIPGTIAMLVTSTDRMQSHDVVHQCKGIRDTMSTAVHNVLDPAMDLWQEVDIISTSHSVRSQERDPLMGIPDLASSNVIPEIRDMLDLNKTTVPGSAWTGTHGIKAQSLDMFGNPRCSPITKRLSNAVQEVSITTSRNLIDQVQVNNEVGMETRDEMAVYPRQLMQLVKCTTIMTMTTKIIRT